MANELIKIDKKIGFPLIELPGEMTKYITPTDLIDINDAIKKTAAGIVEGETDYYMAVFKLAEWTNKNINYSLNTLTEEVTEKSSWVLQNKYGVCDELTNLFISMARSLGIPARFVTGIAYTNIGNKFGNHGWAEVYFPGHGWVPFDVTYGQYGWIDPSHVKFFDSVDSGKPAASYTWKSKNVNMLTYPLSIDANITKILGKENRLVEFSISPLVEEASFGSYVPVEVAIENINQYYAPVTLRIRKAPGVYEGETSKSILLRPKERGKIYFMLQMPEVEDERYVYTSEIEIVDDYNYAASSKIRYAGIYEKYDLEYAQGIIDELSIAKEGGKELLPDVDAKCEIRKEYVYSDEMALIYCSVANTGNKNLKEVKICTLNECSNMALLIGEKKDKIIARNFKSSGDALIKVAYNGDAKYLKQYVTVVKKPAVMLKGDVAPDLKYNEPDNATVEITTNTKINNVTINIGKLNRLEIDELEGKYVVVIPIKGKMLYKKQIDVDLKYKDAVGKHYFLSSSIKSNIANAPWYAGLTRIFSR